MPEYACCRVHVPSKFCDVCGHALSRHNDLGNCGVSSPTRGDCTCNMVTAHAGGIKPGHRPADHNESSGDTES